MFDTTSDFSRKNSCVGGVEAAAEAAVAAKLWFMILEGVVEETSNNEYRSTVIDGCASARLRR